MESDRQKCPHTQMKKKITLEGNLCDLIFF